MAGPEEGAGLAHHPGRLAEVEPALLGGAGQGAAFDEGGRDVVVGAVGAGLVDRHDVGVAQPGRGLRLAQEALDGGGALQAAGVRHLQGDLALQLRVEGPVDGAEGPGGYDCSGLTLAAWRAAGKSLPHNAAMQWDATARITALVAAAKQYSQLDRAPY